MGIDILLVLSLCHNETWYWLYIIVNFYDLCNGMSRIIHEPSRVETCLPLLNTVYIMATVVTIILEIHGNQIDSSLRGMGMDLTTDASEANMLYRPFGTVYTKFNFNDKTCMVPVLNANKDVNNIVIFIIVIFLC